MNVVSFEKDFKAIGPLEGGIVTLLPSEPGVMTVV